MQAGTQLVFGLTGAEVVDWLSASVDVLNQCQNLLNQANVFPVPDADTGTNMLLTMRGALDRARTVCDQPESPGAKPASGPHEVLVQAALGALTHARGNSGIILAEYLRGIARAVSHNQQLEPHEQLIRALREAAQRAYSAVAQPVEGTILTAARAAAHGALEAGESSEIGVVIEHAIASATQALERSHLDLAVLARAGVLDAGAYGLILILSTLRTIIADIPVTRRSALGTGATAGEQMPAVSGIADGEFEVMCLVTLEKSGPLSDEWAELRTLAFRSALAELGESVVVIGGAQSADSALWSVHIHTDTPDQVIHALERVGAGQMQLTQIVVRNLVQHMAISGLAAQPRTTHTKLVVCTAGPALTLDLSRSGAIVCLERGKPIQITDIERALTEVHHGTQHDLTDAVVISHSTRLTDALRRSEHALAVVPAHDDAQVVAATSAILADWEAHPHRTTAELVDAGTRCVESLETFHVAWADRPTLLPLLERVARGGNGTPVVTLLLDESCPLNAVTDLTDGIERSQTDAEIIVLSSGRLGEGLTASVEWIHD